ncbi:class I SAM-dependent methyltransferase [Haloechinothrix sp. YIM 98757]|uniref:Class I SAM-dependent methyltransferase n=1 Tax=Haloechinothrix aidingensis TaxID=2752311 RepID=A0A838AB52_9PSEU|nr:class I SAM-dependent methyltransferase [Haloechinothrix aidingensis]MBA0126482.1 class I SAM-dependent methyltransferase [Haloechinothrix aidingensis]
MSGASEPAGPCGPDVPSELREHPDRFRWNERYREADPDFAPHQLVTDALAAGLPAGPVLELACGRSGSALALAAAGRTVTAVDISDHALAQLGRQARRRGLDARVRRVLADLPAYPVAAGRYALVLATRYWDPDVFGSAAAAVLPGGLLGWEALAQAPGGERGPYRVAHGELGARLPATFTVLAEELYDSERHRVSRLLARRQPAAPGLGGAERG